MCPPDFLDYIMSYLKKLNICHNSKSFQSILPNLLAIYSVCHLFPTSFTLLHRGINCILMCLKLPSYWLLGPPGRMKCFIINVGYFSHPAKAQCKYEQHLWSGGDATGITELGVIEEGSGMEGKKSEWKENFYNFFCMIALNSISKDSSWWV